MCGITGFNGHGGESLLSAMVEKLQHRGPDGWGQVLLPDPPDNDTERLRVVGLGHTRLSIIDLTTASNQPLLSACGTAVIVLNGEIYNYQEQRELLIQKGYEFNSQGDAEVLLNLYIEYGTDCLNHIDGMFAFAIWDLKESQLFLARDPFGVKPLYYSHTGRDFFFSSEIKSLLASPSISRKLDINAIYRTIQFMYSPGPDTVLKHVKKLEPGHFLLVKKGRIEEKVSYWAWPDYDPTLTDAPAAARAIRETLGKAVSDQLVADVPVGSFLSGGLDSSLITALAKRGGNSPMTSFTIREAQGESRNDGFVADLPYAIQAANDLNVDLQFVNNKTDLATELQDLIYHLDEPQGDVAPLYVAKICKVAREQGFTVLLSGVGGDDVFGGYRRHRALTLEKYWRFLPKRARRKMKLMAMRLPVRNALFRRLKIAFRHADLDDEKRLLSYFYWIDSPTLRSIFTSKHRKKLLEEPNEALLQQLEELGDIPPLEKMLHLERRHYLADHCLNYTDKMSMKHGVEVRVPFLNTALAELVMTLPARFKQRGRTGKWLLKKTALRYLSRKVIYRPKTGFDGPLREWLDGDLKPVIEQYLGRQSVRQRGLFKPETIEQMLHDTRIGRADYTYPIFAILCIELWCRIHLENQYESVSDDVSKDVPADEPANVPTESSDDLPDDLPDDSPEDVSSNEPNTDSYNPSDDVSNDVSSDVPNNAGDEASVQENASS